MRKITGFALAAFAVVSLALNYGCGSCVSFGPGSTLSFQVLITSPSNNAGYPLNSPIPVSIKAYSGNPVQTIQLMADGKAAGSAQAQNGEATIVWKAETEGTHSIRAVAVDSAQKSETSNAIQITVTAEVAPPRLNYTIKPGDTLENIAASYGVTSDAIKAENPGLSGPETGKQILIPLGICKTCKLSSGAAKNPVISSQLQLINGKLMLPKVVQYAYAYLSFDNVSWQRIPDDDKTFLSPVNNTLDISPFLHDAGGKKSPAVYVEAWGWDQGKLVGLGATHADMSNTSLTICDARIGCSGDMAAWRKELSLPKDEKNKAMKLNWQTNIPGVSNGLVQISPFPFSSSTSLDSVYGKIVPAGSFTIDFDDPYGSGGQNASPLPGVFNLFSSDNKGQGILSTISKISTTPVSLFNYTYYVRVLPVKDNQVIESPSNPVAVNIVPPDHQDIPLYFPPKALEIKIKEFRPFHYPESGVCSHRIVVDEDYKYFNTVFHKGDVICPQPFMGIGEKSWYEQFFNAISSGLSWISKAYNALKSAVVDGLAGIACGGNETCRAGIAAGLDIGLVAMGLPPNIPDFNELANQGLDYLASEIAEQTGVPAGAIVDVAQKLKKTLDDNKKVSSPECMDEGTAHAMSIEPFCFPGMKYHWDSRAIESPARVMLEVKRKDDPSIKDEDYQRYEHEFQVVLSFWATNDTFVGGKITNIPPNDESVIVDKPLAGALFKTAIVPVPPLKRGQSLTIPVNAIGQEYWIPGHKEAMHGWNTVVINDGYIQQQYDDWWSLYAQGKLNIMAVVNAKHQTNAGNVAADSVTDIYLPLESEAYKNFDKYIYHAP